MFAHWPQNHRGNEEAWSLKTVHSDAAMMLLMIIAQAAVATSVILSEVVTSGYIDSTRS